MFNIPPMPTREELTAMTDADLEKRLKDARKALNEAEQLAKNSREQESIFAAYQEERDRRTKGTLQREAEAGDDDL